MLEAGGVEIRRLGLADLPILGRIAEDVFDGPILSDRAIAFLADPHHLMVVAVSRGEVIGQIRGVVHYGPDRAPEIYIDNLGVTPGRQREGIGRTLVDALLAWGRELGCEEAWVATETGNVAARTLYGGRGFSEETVAYFGREL